MGVSISETHRDLLDRVMARTGLTRSAILARLIDRHAPELEKTATKGVLAPVLMLAGFRRRPKSSKT
jgi:hypothetical protein